MRTARPAVSKGAPTVAARRVRDLRMLERPPLFGLESEYPVTFFARGGGTVSREECSGHVVRDAGRRIVSLPGRDAFDLFLSNGARFYRDAGCGLCNLEYASPECTSPDELIAHARAGDAMVARAVDDFVACNDHVEAATVSKCCVDYQGHTSGSHENHLHSQPWEHLASQLVPMLTTRALVSGGGGFDDTSPGLDFMCSPRVSHLEHAVSRGAQDSRAIFTIKDQSLGGPEDRRLQLLSSEGVCCEASERLRFAPVALVARIVAAGARPGDSVRFADPLAAIKVFARDPSGTATAQLANGAWVTALDVQRHYLDQVEAYSSEAWMPEWSDTECTRWRWGLDTLAEDPHLLIGHLDWPTKRRLYVAHCEQRGILWETLPRWGLALRELLAGTRPAGPGEHVDEARPTPRLEPLLEWRGRDAARITGTLENHGLSGSDLPRFVALRNELFELDIRFGEIGPDSLFAALEREGIIAAGSVDPEAIARAASEPPATRAKLRAAWIRHLHPKRDAYRCDWTGIYSPAIDGHLNLRDPFGRGSLAPPPAPSQAHGPQATPATASVHEEPVR
jgi:proteasome accessory factor A